ncbi:large ribosomal subunit protein uL10m-like [Calliopsis andreniformis]|uniref:large ribosomal subunit protein uL10m-like n=1 Tax=Calliopsis andreniformis TaxID=337506 RepID=UPI003FCE254B
MAHFITKAFQLTPNQLLYQQKRFRGKINIKKPKIFYKNKVLNELLTPFYINPNKDKTLEEFCSEANVVRVEKELGPYDKILVKDIRNWFDNSKMIACVHVNSIYQEDLFEIEVPLRRANMYFKRYGRHLMNAAIEDTPYEGLKPLISNFSAWIFSPDINVTALQKIIKKTTKLYTIGGALEGYVLNYDDFLKYGQMDMMTAQVGLVQVLQNAGGVNLNRQLTHHQSTLVTRLGQIGTNAKQTNENDQSASV